jgi:hypothetical protein
VNVRKSESEAKVTCNECIHCPIGVIPRGSIYGAVSGPIYIVQTAPNCPMNCTEYIVTGSL